MPTTCGGRSQGRQPLRDRYGRTTLVIHASARWSSTVTRACLRSGVCRSLGIDRRERSSRTVRPCPARGCDRASASSCSSIQTSRSERSASHWIARPIPIDQVSPTARSSHRRARGRAHPRRVERRAPGSPDRPGDGRPAIPSRIRSAGTTRGFAKLRGAGFSGSLDSNALPRPRSTPNLRPAPTSNPRSMPQRRVGGVSSARRTPVRMSTSAKCTLPRSTARSRQA